MTPRQPADTAPVERRPIAMVSSVLAVIVALTLLVSGTGLQPATSSARDLAARPGLPTPRALRTPTPEPTAPSVPTPTPPLEWPATPVVERAKAEGRTFATFAMADGWANYGEQFTTFCEQVLGYDCDAGHARSLGETMVSSEVISAFTSDGFEARAALGGIWSLAIPYAAASGALAPYTSPNARHLPTTVRGDGWLLPFSGVPGFIVNEQRLAELKVPAPSTWADLARPIYRGLVGMGTPGSSPSGTAAFLAIVLGHGGRLTDYAPVRTLARALAANVTQPAQDVKAFQAGTPPIDVAMDYDLTWMDEVVSQDGTRVTVVIPDDGSLYVPEAVVANGYDTAHMDLTKLFMDYLLSDAGQTIFAKYGGHPIRAVVKDPTYVIPASARDLLLGDATYANTKLYDLSVVDPTAIYGFWTTEVGGS